MHVVAAVALLAGLGQADPICADLQRLSAATADPTAYAELYRSDFAPRLLNGCFRSDGYFCGQSMLPPDVTHETMAARIAACLPGAEISPGEEWPGLRRTNVTGGGLRFELAESGSERAQVGRTLKIRIRPAASR
ncbi:hypothetical protein [Sphingomonas soli]|uniref:hypothetical protein n=1 Tax=Sphingomonas soli TaxID=266127 RepID=UPI00082BB971|nr:hypothetical protein [Sphingomonas soli]